MLARLRSLLIVSLVTALAPLATPPALGPEYPVVHQHNGPAVSADHGALSLALRGEERVEINTTEPKPAQDQGGDALDSTRRTSTSRARTTRAWCDHLQCRRLAGAQLLHYATPPPTRG